MSILLLPNTGRHPRHAGAMGSPHPLPDDCTTSEALRPARSRERSSWASRRRPRRGVADHSRARRAGRPSRSRGGLGACPRRRPPPSISRRTPSPSSPRRGAGRLSPWCPATCTLSVSSRLIVSRHNGARTRHIPAADHSPNGILGRPSPVSARRTWPDPTCGTPFPFSSFSPAALFGSAPPGGILKLIWTRSAEPENPSA